MTQLTSLKLTSRSFAVWFAFCAALGVAIVGFGVWATIKIIDIAEQAVSKE